MEINVTFLHSQPSPALRQHIDDKIQKLAKYFIKPTMAHVTLKIDDRHHVAEISLSENHSLFNAKEATYDMYASFDEAVKKIERQLKKYKERIKDHHKKPLRMAASA